MKELIKVVMLPTEDTTNIIIPTAGVGKGVLHLKEYYGNAMLDMGDEYHHLYITVSQDIEPIKEGDWIIVTNASNGENFLKQEGSILPKALSSPRRKIIATTDPKLINDKGGMFKTLTQNIPQIPQSFLKEFVTNPDGEYEVEYEEMLDNTSINQAMTIGMNIDDMTSILSLKPNQDNTVNITSVEEKRYSKEEVEEFGLWLGNNYKKNKNKLIDVLFNDWIKENL
jgi:hypothetical protein